MHALSCSLQYSGRCVVRVYSGWQPWVVQLIAPRLLQVAECAAGDAGRSGGAGGGGADGRAARRGIHLRPCAVLCALHHHAHLHDGARALWLRNTKYWQASTFGLVLSYALSITMLTSMTVRGAFGCSSSYAIGIRAPQPALSNRLLQHSATLQGRPSDGL